MNQLKPNWNIAQQISRRHTFISLAISMTLFLIVTILAIIILKLSGVPESGVFLKNFVNQHRAVIFTCAFFIHFVPINYFAIIKVFQTSYQNFDLKIISRDGTTGSIDKTRN